MANTAKLVFTGTLDNTEGSDNDVQLVVKDNGGNKVVLGTAAAGTSTPVSGTLGKQQLLDIENA
jgi:hypothetical protein